MPKIVPHYTFIEWMHEIWAPGSNPRDFDVVSLGWTPRICILTNISGVSDVSGQLSWMTFWKKQLSLHSLTVSSTLMTLLSIYDYHLIFRVSLSPAPISHLSSRLIYSLVSWTPPFDYRAAPQSQHDQSKNNFSVEITSSSWVFPVNDTT